MVRGVAPLLIICIHKYSKLFEHAQTVQNVWQQIGMLNTTSKHASVLPGGVPPLWFGVLVCWWYVSGWVHPMSGVMVLWFGVLVAMYVCS